MPSIPLVRSKQTPMGAAGLDRSFSDVKATPEMYGAREGAALASLGKTVGDGLTGIAEELKTQEASRVNEKISYDIATANFAETALEAQKAVPPTGEGLVKTTQEALEKKINDKAAEYTNPRDAAAFRTRANGYLGQYITSAAGQQYKMGLDWSKTTADTALNATDNQLRTNPSGYETALKQSVDVINSSQVIPQSLKEHAKIEWGQRLANTRFEGMIEQAKTVDELKAIDRELTTPKEGGEPNDWQGRIKQPDYDKLRNTLKQAITHVGTQAHANATAEMDRLEKITADPRAEPLDNETLQMTKKVITQSSHPMDSVRFGRLVQNEELKRQYRQATPAQMKTDANNLRQGVGGMHPGLPNEVNGYITEATTLVPGVSASYLAATAMREYGGNFPKRQPAQGAANISIQDRSAEAGFGETFGKMSGVRGMVVHHTAGQGDVSGVISTFKQRNYPAHFVIDRDGQVYQTLPDGARGQHMKNGWGKGEGFSNDNMEGVEIIANDDNDVTPVQRDAAIALINQRAAKFGYDPRTSTYGHGEVNPGHKQVTEGMSTVNVVRQGVTPTAPIDYSKTNDKTGTQGLFQFKDTTFRETVTVPNVAAVMKSAGYDVANMSPQQLNDLRKDPRASTLAAAAYAQSNKTNMERVLGRPVNDAELYMSHFLGATGGVKFLVAYQENPDQPVTNVVSPDALDKNKTVFMKSQGSGWPRTVANNESAQPYTVREVYDRVTASVMANPSRVAYEGAVNLEKQADERRKALDTNPRSVARAAKIIPEAQPIDSNPSSWAARGADANRIASYYNLPEAVSKPFDADTEVQVIKKQLADGTSEDVAKLLKNMAVMDNVAPGSMMAGLEQAGEKNSTYARAGELMLNGRDDAAMAVLAGTKIMAKDDTHKVRLGEPGGEKADEVWTKATGNALLFVPPETREAVYKSANAHYLATSAGIVSKFDKALYVKSINAVLGGDSAPRVDTVNSDVTVLPKGVDGGTMNAAVDNLQPEDLVKYAVGRDGKPSMRPPYYTSGDPVPPMDIATQGKFRFVGGDTYQIQMPNGKFIVTAPRVQGGPLEPYLIKLDRKAVSTIASRPQDVLRSLTSGYPMDDAGLPR